MREETVWRGASVLRPFLVPIRDLEPFPGNPRRGDVAAVRSSLHRFGQVRAILTDAENARRIVAGHHLVLAALEEGWTHVAAMPNEFKNEGEARAYLLADNRTHDLGGYDGDLLLAQLDAVRGSGLEGTGFDASYVEALERDLRKALAPDEPRGDRIPPVPKRPKSKRGEVYEFGAGHRLMCGNSTDPADVDALLAGEKPPLIFTSPPYGVGLDYASYDDSIENLRGLLEALSHLWADHVPPGGFCVTNFGDNYSARGLLGEAEPCEYPMAVEYWPIFRANDWLLHSRRVFVKAPTATRDPWTFESNRAAFDWEHLWTWKRPGKGLTERREPSWDGVWDIGKATGGSSRETVRKDSFPAAFPVTLALWVLRVYSNRGDAVADPFAGSGTVALAAELTGRRALLMEQSPAYCDVIRSRFAAFQEAKENLSWSASRAAA